MRTREIADFLKPLGCELPPAERFWKLGDLTALRQDDSGGFYRANYERGILLYSLVARYRPRAVLEFGTGRGYGCLCMAWAMEDYQIPGRVYTIDMVGQDEAFPWPVDWGNGPRVESLARSQVWPKAAPESWLRRIEVLTGRTGRIMARWPGPPVDMVFIDAGHDYSAVRHDLYSALNVVGESFGILFDDYAPQPGFGVQRLIDEEVAPHFEAELVYTDRRWPGGERANIADPGYGMVWIHSDTLRAPLDRAYPPDVRRRILQGFRRRELWRALRQRLGRVRRRLLTNGASS